MLNFRFQILTGIRGILVRSMHHYSQLRLFYIYNGLAALAEPLSFLPNRKDTTYQHFSDGVQQPKAVQASFWPFECVKILLHHKIWLTADQRVAIACQPPSLNHRLVVRSDNTNAGHVFSAKSLTYEKKHRHSGCADR